MLSRLVLAATLALGGCLFVGDINQRPSVQLAIETGFADEIVVGSSVLFSAEVHDDQPHPMLELAVLDSNNAPADPCAYTLSFDDAADTVPQMFTVVFWQPGSYSVAATPIDKLGAVGSNSVVQLGVVTVPPSFSEQSMQLAPNVVASACGDLYPSGAPIPIRIDGMIVDPQAAWTASAPTVGVGSVACTPPPVLSLTWQLVSVPDASQATLGLPQGTSCPPSPTNGSRTLTTDASVDLVCLYPDANLPTGSPSMYGVTLTLDEGSLQSVSDTLEIPAIGNAPACLDGVYPAAGTYVLTGDEVTVFQAIAVDDIDGRDASLDYVWSIEGPNATSYAVLGSPATAAQGGDRFSFDPTALGFGVGDEVKLRVDVSDPLQSAAACSDSDDTCMVASCVAAPATMCPRRATWEIELR